MTMTTSRRAVLVGAAALPALAVPAIAMPAQVDPVFSAIENHRRLSAAYSEACDIFNDLEGRLFNKYRNIHNASIPMIPVRENISSGGWKSADVFEYRIESGKPTGEFHYASSASEITKSATEIPKEHREAWIADRRGALAREKRRLRRLRIDSGFEHAEHRQTASCHAEYKAGQELLKIVPPTLAGIKALIDYVLDSVPGDARWLLPDGDDAPILLRSLADALASHIGAAVRS